MNLSKEFQKALAFDGYVSKAGSGFSAIQKSGQRARNTYKKILSYMYKTKTDDFYIEAVPTLPDSNADTKEIKQTEDTGLQYKVIKYEDVKFQYELSFGQYYKFVLDSLYDDSSIEDEIRDPTKIIKLINQLHENKIDCFTCLDDEYIYYENVPIQESECFNTVNLVYIDDVYKNYLNTVDINFSQAYTLYKSSNEQDLAKAKKHFLEILNGQNKNDFHYGIYNFALTLYHSNSGKMPLAHKLFSFIVKKYTKEIVDFMQDKDSKQFISMAQYYLAECYNYSFGCDSDFEKAALYYNMAIKNGNKMAVKPLEDLVKMFEHQANEGFGYFQYNLALCYQYGRGIEKSDYKADELFDKAAANGYVKFSKKRLI